MKTSTLYDLNMSKKALHNIFHNLRVKHDATFEPVKTKAEAKLALKSHKVIVAVKPDGNAVGIGHYDYPMKGGHEVYVAGTGDIGVGNICSLTSGMSRIQGRGYKFYKSTEAGVSAGKSYRRPDYSYGRNFLDKFHPFERVIKKDAENGYQDVLDHLMGVIEDETINHDANFLPREHNLNKIKMSMLNLKRIAENGLSSWDGGFSRGSRVLAKQFLGKTYDYELDYAAEDFEEHHKLAVHKFVKFVRQQISNEVSRAITGQFETHGLRAKDYPDEM